MKPAGLLVLIPVGLLSPAEAAEPTPAIVSREISAHIRAGLPAYQPPPAKPDDQAADTPGPAEPPDPSILVLPKMTVKEQRLPPDAADHLMSRDALKRKMENVYLDEIAKDGELNYFLNKFTIPLLSPSKEERGRAITTRRELDRLSHVSKAARALDPDAEKKFQKELDNTHTTRPAGGLRK